LEDGEEGDGTQIGAWNLMERDAEPRADVKILAGWWSHLAVACSCQAELSCGVGAGCGLPPAL
jgi:hypothetical protein